MQELKGKAEFFQQYIMERFRKLREQRSVGTNTDELESEQLATSIESLVQNCDDAIAAKVSVSLSLSSGYYPDLLGIGPPSTFLPHCTVVGDKIILLTRGALDRTVQTYGRV